MTNKVDQFTHLHVHTESSLLDGYDSIPELVAEVKRLGQKAVAITDHGSLSGIYDLYKEAKANDITPIAGLEAYVVPSIGDRHSRSPLYLGDGGRDDVAGRGSYTHLTLLAENNIGLKNLFKLSLLASTEGFYQKPRIDLELMSEYAEGLIATTGCPSGEIQIWLRMGRMDKALAYAAQLQDIFGRESVFVELMEHGMKKDLERKVRGGLLEIAQKLKMPIIATNDLHYARKEDAVPHEHMLAIQTRALMSEPADYDGGSRFAFEGGSYYVKSAAEMAQLFPDHPEALSNTMLIAERASFSIEPDEGLRPKLPTIPEGYTEAEWLSKEAFDGLKKRLPDKADSQVYIDRMNKELKVINEKNFSGYFLVVSDFVRWGKFIADPAVPTGPGRGSAAGSLLAYALDITDADPIRFDLLFERFINPERDSPPDIDMDFNDTDRERVIEYVKNKYGNDFVAMVTTFGKIGAKTGIKDIVRIMEEPYSQGDALSKALPPPIFGKEIKLSQVYDPNADRYDEAADFRELVEKENLQHIVEAALKLEGRTRSMGVHAAALVISSQPVVDTIPMYMRQADKALITQWDYPTSEELGLLKVDFLGLRNLGVVRDAIQNVENNHGVKIDLQALIHGPMDDPKAYSLLQRGDTLGVFQLDGGGMRKLLRQLKPTEFDDISALLSLYRPGPMGVGAHEAYARRKNGLEAVEPIHPEFADSLKDILEPTYGLIVYQEQVQLIAQVVAGYSLGQADLLRRAMGKKKKSILEAEFGPFSAGAKAKGYSDEAIKVLWSILVPFADYAFNKSHTVAYGLISYSTAFLKANYPSEFMAALLTSVSDDTDKIAAYLDDCKHLGLKVNTPDINMSFEDFYPASDKEIYFGMKAVRGLGGASATEIVKTRTENGKFKSFLEFVEKVPQGVANKRILEGLAHGGGFDSFKIPRKMVVENLPDLLKLLSKFRKTAVKNEVSLFDMFDDSEAAGLGFEYEMKPYQEYERFEKLRLERHVLGLYVSDNPLNGLNLDNGSTNKISDLLSGVVPPFEGWRAKGEVSIAGIVSSLEVKRSKKTGEAFAMGVFEDQTGSIPFAMFSKVYAQHGNGFVRDAIFQVTGQHRLDRDGESVQFVVDSVRPLDFGNGGSLNVRVRLTEKQWSAGQDELRRRLLKHYEFDGSLLQLSVLQEDGSVEEFDLEGNPVKRSSALMADIRELFGLSSIGRWRVAVPKEGSSQPQVVQPAPRRNDSEERPLFE